MCAKIASEAVREGMKHCFNCFGLRFLSKNSDIFESSLKFLVSDASYRRECDLFNSAFKKIGGKLFEIHSLNEEDRQDAYSALLQDMIENGNYYENIAKYVLETFACSLGWPVAQDTLREIYKDKQVGDRFDFGRYPQGSSGEIKPITWRVLRRDSESLLVIAEMSLDCKRYNEKCVDITWADCTLRDWLNDEFYKKAFNEQERSLIKKTALTNNAGPSTEDYVFLLSVDEARSLFADHNDLMCKPTEYAVKNGAWLYVLQFFNMVVPLLTLPYIYTYLLFCVW